MMLAKNENEDSNKVNEVSTHKITKIICSLLLENKDITTTCVIRRIIETTSKHTSIPSREKIRKHLKNIKSQWFSQQIMDAEREMDLSVQNFGKSAIRFYNKTLNKVEHALVFYSVFQEYILEQNVSFE